MFHWPLTIRVNADTGAVLLCAFKPNPLALEFPGSGLSDTGLLFPDDLYFCAIDRG